MMEKMQHDPAHVTARDANHLESKEARAAGIRHPAKDSISAEAKRMAAANETGRDPVAAATKVADPAGVAKHKTDGTADGAVEQTPKAKGGGKPGRASIGKGNGTVNGMTNGASKKEDKVLAMKELKNAIDTIEPKIYHEPHAINDDDAEWLEYAEKKAHGHVRKESYAAKALSLAKENKAATAEVAS